LEEVQVHSIGEGYAVAVNIWNVDGFTGPGGVEIPACRHRSTVLLAKGAEGWKVVHFHNTTIDEAALKGATAPPPQK
jgi:ketosteroid isomerase-like protein